MSQQLINDYLAELDVLRRISGRSNETHRPRGLPGRAPSRARCGCRDDSPRLTAGRPTAPKPKDPTIRAKFDTYRFADYKEKVIDLLMRVARVSVETMVVVEAMKTGPR